MDWLSEVMASEAMAYCDTCGDAAHVEIDTRMRCVVCGRDNGQAKRIEVEANRLLEIMRKG